MHKVDSQVLPQGCKLISLPNVVDERGMLAYGQCMKEIPFEIKRVFWTYGITEGSARGDHAHRTCSMVLFPLGGSFRILLDDGDDLAVDGASSALCKPHDNLIGDVLIGIAHEVL